MTATWFSSLVNTTLGPASIQIRRARGNQFSTNRCPPLVGESYQRLCRLGSVPTYAVGQRRGGTKRGVAQAGLRKKRFHGGEDLCLHIRHRSGEDRSRGLFVPPAAEFSGDVG